MRVVWRWDWHRWVFGVYIDRLTVSIFIGPLLVDFLYRWNQVKELFADDPDWGDS